MYSVILFSNHNLHAKLGLLFLSIMIAEVRYKPSLFNKIISFSEYSLDLILYFRIPEYEQQQSPDLLMKLLVEDGTFYGS